MRSKGTTVRGYVDSLPAERRETIGAVLRTMRKHMPEGYEERSTWGMPRGQVPLRVFPDTSNGQPRRCAGLVSQKNPGAVYRCNVYGIPALRKKLEAGFRAAGKRLDMGKSCLRFRTLDELTLDVIGKMVAATPMKAFVRFAKSVYSKRK